MKDFLKFTLASLIGVILAGVVLTVLGLITVVGMVASSDSETIVKDNSVFVWAERHFIFHQKSQRK